MNARQSKEMQGRREMPAGSASMPRAGVEVTVGVMVEVMAQATAGARPGRGGRSG